MNICDTTTQPENLNMLMNCVYLLFFLDPILLTPDPPPPFPAGAATLTTVVLIVFLFLFLFLFLERGSKGKDFFFFGVPETWHINANPLLY